MQHAELFSLLLRRKWILLGVFAGTVALHAGWLRASPERFRSDAILQVRERAAGEWNSQDFRGVEIYEPFSAAILTQLLADSGFADDVRIALAARSLSELAPRWSAGRLSLSSEKGNDFVRVEYEGARRDDVEPLLEAAVVAAKKVSQNYFERGLAEGRLRLGKRLERESSALARLDARLRELARGAGIVPGSGVEEQRRALIATLETLDLKEVECEARCAELRERVRGWHDPAETGTGEYALLRSLQGTPVYALIQDISLNLIRAELQLARKRQTLTEAHPDLKLAREEVRTEKKLFASVFDEESPLAPHIQNALHAFSGEQNREHRHRAAELLAGENRLAGTRELRRQKQSQLEQLRGFQRELSELQGDRTAQERRCASLEENLRQLDFFSNLAPAVVQVFRPPGTPVRVGPRLDEFLPFVLILAALISIGFCYGLEHFDHRIHNQHVLHKHCHLPLLGTLPVLAGPEEIPRPGRPTEGVEAFNSILKKTLVGLGDGTILLVSGPDAAAGKSLFAFNLAVCAGRFGIDTLLVDCDLRQPRAGSLFQLPTSPGLVEWLRGDEVLGREPLERRLQAVSAHGGSIRLRPSEIPRARRPGEVGVIMGGAGFQRVVQSTGHEHLSIITSGEAVEDPSVLLESEAMNGLLDGIRRRYSLCIIDSPPLSVVADALLIAPRVDGAILLLRAGLSTSQGLHWARQSLDDVGAKTLGTVLNGLAQRIPGYYSYYQGRRHYRARV